MGKRYTREDLEKYREDLEAERAKKQTEQKEEVQKENARRAWFRANGDPELFEQQWPEMYREIQAAERKALAEERAATDSQIREANRHSSASKF